VEEAKHLIDDLGYSEDAAKREVDRRHADRQEIATIKKRLAYTDIRDLAKEGGMYAGAGKYADEIYDAMQRFSIDAKRAFLMVCDPDAIAASLKEEQTQREQRDLLSRGNAAGKVENASPAPPAPTAKLTSHDREILAEMQKAQPGMGWTADKYWKEVKSLQQ
jgi:hypothetical protein